MKCLVLGDSWGYGTIYIREYDEKIIGSTGIYLSTTTIGGLTCPPS
jgi:hypothetical protein